MIQKVITKQPKALVIIAITVPWTDLAAKWEENLAKMAQEVELSGFRKGQAPLPMVEQNLGNKLTDEFIKVVMPQLLVEALQGTDIVPIDYPKYQAISFNKGQQLSFQAMITERPVVKVGDYKKLTVQRPVVKIISDADVDKVVGDLYKRWKAKQAPLAAAVSSQQPTVSVGSVSLDQPNGSTILNAAGSPISSNGKADEPNDGFAKAVGAQSLADLKAKIKADLEDEAKFNNELDFEELILQEIEKITEVDVPDILVEDELNRMLVNLQRRVADMGLLLEDYLKGQNQTLEGLKNSWRPQALKNVRMELGLADVGRKENVNISDEELQAEVDKIQDARLKAQFEAREPRLHLKHSLSQVKTLNLLKTVVASA